MSDDEHETKSEDARDALEGSHPPVASSDAGQKIVEAAPPRCHPLLRGRVQPIRMIRVSHRALRPVLVNPA